MTARYRNRTAEVEAVQWTGESNCEEVFAFLGLEHPDDEMDHSVIHIDAPGGTATAQHGDWVVRNERGEFGVCTPGLFAAAYEPVSSVGRVPDTSHAVPREQLLDALDFSYCLGLGFETPEMLLAAYDASRTVPPAPADRAAVRPSTLHAIANHLEGRAVRVFRPEAEVYAEYHAVAAELRRMAAVPAAVSGRTDNETAEPAVPVHAVPLPGSNGISSCCGRPPCEFVGERVTRNPDEVTCPAAPAVGGAQPKEA
jgi:hypothetical protein